MPPGLSVQFMPADFIPAGLAACLDRPAKREGQEIVEVQDLVRGADKGTGYPLEKPAEAFVFPLGKPAG